MSEPDIGAAVRAARLRAGLSMVALAAQSGVSQPFISQIETGAHLPSLITLYRIAAALGCMPGDLLTSPEGTGFAAVDPGAGAGWVASVPRAVPGGDLDSSGDVDVLISGRHKGILEAYRWTLTADNDAPWWQHDGEDFVHILRGHARFEAEGSAATTLGPGESAYLVDTGRRHRFLSVGDERAELLLVVGRDIGTSPVVIGADGPQHVRPPHQP